MSRTPTFVIASSTGLTQPTAKFTPRHRRVAFAVLAASMIAGGGAGAAEGVMHGHIDQRLTGVVQTNPTSNDIAASVASQNSAAQYATTVTATTPSGRVLTQALDEPISSVKGDKVEVFTNYKNRLYDIQPDWTPTRGGVGLGFIGVIFAGLLAKCAITFVEACQCAFGRNGRNATYRAPQVVSDRLLAAQQRLEAFEKSWVSFETDSDQVRRHPLLARVDIPFTAALHRFRESAKDHYALVAPSTPTTVRLGTYNEYLSAFERSLDNLEHSWVVANAEAGRVIPAACDPTQELEARAQEVSTTSQAASMTWDEAYKRASVLARQHRAGELTSVEYAQALGDIHVHDTDEWSLGATGTWYARRSDSEPWVQRTPPVRDTKSTPAARAHHVRRVATASARALRDVAAERLAGHNSVMRAIHDANMRALEDQRRAEQLQRRHQSGSPTARPAAKLTSVQRWL